jgi:cytochrome c553
MFLNISQYVLEHISHRTFHPTHFSRPVCGSSFCKSDGALERLSQALSVICQGSLMRKRVQQRFAGWRSLVAAAICGAFAVGFFALPAFSGEASVPRERLPPGKDRVNEPANSISKQALQAKLAYCEECHGTSARGFHGYYPIPRLAGQQIEYLQNQLHAFVERRRRNNIMFHVSRALSPEMMAALATNFYDLNPKPLGGAQRELVAKGKEIYEGGIPDKNVPACSSYHGNDAKGNGPMPRLAGQLFEYISNKLTDWDKERGQDPGDPDSSAIMQPIARSLTDAQIKAIAAYLSELE